MHSMFIGDSFGVAGRWWIGVDNIRWSSYYPYTASTWPHPRDIIERDFRDPNEQEKCKIVREKVTQLYPFDFRLNLRRRNSHVYRSRRHQHE